MKTRLTLFLLTISLPLFAQNRIALFGVPDKNDFCNKMIATSDDLYLVAGTVNDNASLYLYDCATDVVASTFKSIPGSNNIETFQDVLELPNGQFIAVGNTNSANLGLGDVMLMRTGSDLGELAFNTFKIQGKDAEARSIVRGADGLYYIAGNLTGEGPDLRDAFAARIDPQTLELVGPPLVFSFGIDVLFSANPTSDSCLLLSGLSAVGDIFPAETAVLNRAFVRKVKLDGTVQWDFFHDQTIKNKFGRIYYTDAIENTNTGNIIAAGLHYQGDTLTGDITDPYFTLLTPEGEQLDDLSIPIGGYQRMNESVFFSLADAPILSVGDSIGANGAVAPVLLATVEYFDQLIPVLELVVQGVPLSITTITEAPVQRFGFAGIYIDPLGGANNQDNLIAVPSIDVFIQQNGPDTLTAITSPPGNYQYQWYKSDQALFGETDPYLVVDDNGTYAVLVTDPYGCLGINVTSFTVASFEPGAGIGKVYPNPFEETLSVELPDEFSLNGTLSLIDATGKAVRSTDISGQTGNIQLETADLPAGLYWVQIRTAEKVWSVKVIHQ